MQVRLCSLVLSLISLSLSAAAPAASPGRFVAKLADGTLVEGNDLTDWQKPDAAPKLHGQLLLDPAKPMQWLRDRSLSPGEPSAAYVELLSGDRLPGTISGFRREEASAVEQQGAHWIVLPSCAVRPPRALAKPEIRVLARFVRRVVWQRRQIDRYQPGTLFCRDGKAFTFRTAKISDGSVTLLLADGTRRVSFDEIAELHLSGAEAWERYLDELAVLSPDGQTRLMQLETDDGLVLTGSLRQFQAFSFDASKGPDGWGHGLQPAWALDVVWVPHSRVMVRRMFAAHEVPLSRVPPLKTPPSLASRQSTWAWQLNRNTRGGMLRSGGQEYGWGYGVHAFSELHFVLPPLARVFRTSVGLDRVVEAGGCIQANVFVGQASGPPLFQSPVIVGSDKVISTGNLALAAAEGKPLELILQVDPAHAIRPPGADPFDIRDTTDWLDPVVEMDAEKWRAEIRRHAAWQIAAWKDWTIAGTEATSWPVALREFPDRPGSYVPTVVNTPGSLVLSRPLRLGDDERWLLLSLSQTRTREKDKSPAIQVRINGELALDQPVPFREQAQTEVSPLVLSLAEYRRNATEDVNLEIRLRPTAEETPVEFRGLTLVGQLPMLRTLFEDVGKFAFLDGDSNATATVVNEEPYSGQAAVKLTAGGRFRLQLPHQEAIRERPAWGEYRCLLFAFRKSGAGRVCLELEHRDSQSRPLRYDAGQGEPSYGKAVRVWSAGQLPETWIVISRDIYADFGAVDLTAITVSAPDGQSVLCDHIYLARSLDDFKLLPNAPSAEQTNLKARQTLAKPVLDKALPACVAIDFGNGRWGTGTLINPQGGILTAGHLVLGPDKPVTVHLADKRALPGTTRGVSRELDVGLVQLSGTGQYPFVEIEGLKDFPAQELYVGLLHKTGFAPGQAPLSAVVGLRRVLKDAIWTDFDDPKWSAGGPLFNATGKQIAIVTRRSSFGGLLYSKLEAPWVFLERLKKGEVWGSWQLGTGPMTGVVITTTAEGCKVTEVIPDLSAARQGIQVGDYFRQVNGRPTLTLDDIYLALADKDPGQEIDVDYVRGKEARKAKIQLGQRVP